MASSVLEIIKEEVTCSICLDLMVEPVSTDCGHSFCRACITLNYESIKGKEEEGICPVCGVTYLFGHLRPNRHVANIVESLLGFKSNPEEEQNVNVCAQHGEKLQLFCEKDMVAICWLCERSQDHRGHQTALIEEVAHEYKEKLQAALEMQMANEKICDEWEDDLQKERTFWENQIQSDVENVQMAFKGLQEFLDFKEKSEKQKLMQEKEDVMNSLAESQNELMKQREAVRDLISDVEHQLDCSTMEMLQGVNSVLTRIAYWDNSWDLCVSPGDGKIQSSFVVAFSIFTNRLESVGTAVPCEPHTSEDWKAVPLYVKSHIQAVDIRLILNMLLLIGCSIFAKIVILKKNLKIQKLERVTILTKESDLKIKTAQNGPKRKEKDLPSFRSERHAGSVS
ncbi:tripartite motif-containing protein 12A isoform X4 [Cricetulus griseus]|nr:tripartite motif-containing protein 12A isoform X4 [Cricetulus griseus]